MNKVKICVASLGVGIVLTGALYKLGKKALSNRLATKEAKIQSEMAALNYAKAFVTEKIELGEYVPYDPEKLNTDFTFALMMYREQF